MNRHDDDAKRGADRSRPLASLLTGAACWAPPRRAERGSDQPEMSEPLLTGENVRRCTYARALKSCRPSRGLPLRVAPRRSSGKCRGPARDRRAPHRRTDHARQSGFLLRTSAKVNTDNPDRGPLLLIMGGKDHSVPEAITKSTFK
jgi:hypothetical protein